jgi:hypothetical protein
MVIYNRYQAGIKETYNCLLMPEASNVNRKNIQPESSTPSGVEHLIIT